MGLTFASPDPSLIQIWRAAFGRLFRWGNIASATSVHGTKRTSSNVRSSVAIEGKADMTRTAQFGSD